jgi:hypothetical protein
VAGVYNPIFDKILGRNDGDRIVAYIAYGLYKERKKAFLVKRSEELNGPVPPEEVATFVRAYDAGQIALIWNAAENSLASFAVDYADAEKKEAVRVALSEALKGNFWRQVGVTTVAGLLPLVTITAFYFLLRIVGVDLLERFRQLEQMFPGT